jgi:diguanylate cyclase (GGDEF)-like protein
MQARVGDTVPSQSNVSIGDGEIRFGRDGEIMLSITHQPAGLSGPKQDHDLMPEQRAWPTPGQFSLFMSTVSENRSVPDLLAHILENQSLSAVFQPIVDMSNGQLIGYEGLIRGPEHSPLYSPINLFRAARENNLTWELEKLCREVILAKFAELALPGKIFLNISPEYLIHSRQTFLDQLEFLKKIALHPDRIVLELTENQATHDYQQMRHVLQHYRACGFQIAIDDLGEGFSSLRLWSEIKPDFVKIDMHFVQGIDQDPVKLQFVQSIQLIAGKSGTVTIAEGIETEAELRLLQELGVACGQGFYIAKPISRPAHAVSENLAEQLKRHVSLASPKNTRGFNLATALKLLRIVPIISPQTSTNDVYDIFMADPTLDVLPVVQAGVPVGIINRAQMIDRLARLYQRELFGKRPCTFFMSSSPMVVDKHATIQEISLQIVDADAHQLFNGFVITDNDQYIGMGTSQDVIREITLMQITAARYANPLTQLPGNVPINEEIDKLVLGGRGFHVCYCDIDHFKPFNDVYGYRRGDDIIQLAANILAAHCEPGVDFIGHIGGDDFIILFQSRDWEQRCQKVLQEFSTAVLDFYTSEDRILGGYMSEDRRGKKVFHSLVTLSLGVVKVEADRNYSCYQISAAAAEAKKRAKAIAGNSLFLERREIK